MADGFVSDWRQAGEVLARLAEEDVACLPLLPAPALTPLLEAARGLSYRTTRGEIGAGARAVRQDFDICMSPPRPSLLWDLTVRLEVFLAQALASHQPALLAGHLSLNDLVVQRYPAGSFGITAYRDHVRYTGLVALILLCGEGRFFACSERSGVYRAQRSSVSLSHGYHFGALQHWPAPRHPGRGLESLILAHLKGGEEGLVRDFHIAELAHAFFAAFLPVE